MLATSAFSLPLPIRDPAGTPKPPVPDGDLYVHSDPISRISEVDVPFQFDYTGLTLTVQVATKAIFCVRV